MRLSAIWRDLSPPEPPDRPDRPRPVRRRSRSSTWTPRSARPRRTGSACCSTSAAASPPGRWARRSRSSSPTRTPTGPTRRSSASSWRCSAAATPASFAGLPRVDAWSIWNEPNWGGLLQPQSVRDRRTRRIRTVAPVLYRKLYRAGVAGLAATGHGSDQILLGETAPLGNDKLGERSHLKPARFLRDLFCLDAALRPLQGRARQAPAVRLRHRGTAARDGLRAPPVLGDGRAGRAVGGPGLHPPRRRRPAQAPARRRRPRPGASRAACRSGTRSTATRRSPTRSAASRFEQQAAVARGRRARGVGRPARGVDRAVPAARRRAARAVRPGVDGLLGDLPERPEARRRHAEAGLRGLPAAAVRAAAGSGRAAADAVGDGPPGPQRRAAARADRVPGRGLERVGRAPGRAVDRRPRLLQRHHPAAAGRASTASSGCGRSGRPPSAAPDDGPLPVSAGLATG